MPKSEKRNLLLNAYDSKTLSNRIERSNVTYTASNNERRDGLTTISPNVLGYLVTTAVVKEPRH